MPRRYFRSRVGVHESGGLRAVRRRLYSRRSTAYGNFFARCGEVLVVRTKRILKNHKVLRAVSPNPANAVWNWSPVGGGLSDRQRRKVYNIVLSELSKLIRNTHAWLRPGLSWLTQNPVRFIDSRAHCRLPKSGGPFSGRNWEALFMVKGTICPIRWTRSPSRNRSVARSRRNCGRRHSAKW
jgi:hypothetical protein